MLFTTISQKNPQEKPKSETVFAVTVDIPVNKLGTQPQNFPRHRPFLVSSHISPLAATYLTQLSCRPRQISTKSLPPKADLIFLIRFLTLTPENNSLPNLPYLCLCCLGTPLSTFFPSPRGVLVFLSYLSIYTANPSGCHQNRNPSGSHLNRNPSGSHLNRSPSGSHLKCNPSGSHLNRSPSGSHLRATLRGII
jgi:hypothetical protein